MQGQTLISSEKFSQFPGLKAAVSTRNGGVSPFPLGMNLSFKVGDDRERVIENRNIFFNRLGLNHNQVAFPLQCHSDNVISVTKAGNYVACDGLITDLPNLSLAVSAADCLPAFIFDPEKKVIAAIHAGWKGTASRIVEKGLQKMVNEFGCDATDCFAFLGPSAGVCCYEVGSDVAEQFDEHCVDSRQGKLFLDLKKANRTQLVRLGVREDHIEVSSYCTICKPELFHSYRRDKERSGRMLGVICMTH